MWAGGDGGKKSFSAKRHSGAHVLIMGLLSCTRLRIWGFGLQLEEASFPERTNAMKFVF